MNGNNIGVRIKTLRESKGLTQSELAKALSVKRETVTHWENGTRDLKTESTIALASFFGVSCDEILTGNRPEHIELTSSLGLTSESIDNLMRLRRCTDCDKWTEEEKNFYAYICEQNDLELADICITYVHALDAINYILAHKDCEGALSDLKYYLDTARSTDGFAVFTEYSPELFAFRPLPNEYQHLFSFLKHLNIWAERQKLSYRLQKEE